LLAGVELFGSELYIYPTGATVTVPFPSPPPPIATMIGSVDAYVVGFSVLLFYVLKTYFEARAVWKQFG